MVKFGQQDIAQGIKSDADSLRAKQQQRREDKRQSAREVHTNGSTPRSTQ